MLSFPRLLIRIAAFCLVVLMMTAGCAPAARRPDGGTTPPGQTSPGTSTNPGAATGAPNAQTTPGTTTNPGTTGTAGTPGVGSAEARRMAEDVRIAAQTVGGVSRAHVVFVGNVAMVGIEPAGTAGGQSGVNPALEKQVGDAVRAREPRITQVYVTTKPDLVGSLARISNGIAGGQPVTNFTAEIARLLTQLAPMASPTGNTAAPPGAPGPGHSS